MNSWLYASIIHFAPSGFMSGMGKSVTGLMEMMVLLYYLQPYLYLGQVVVVHPCNLLEYTRYLHDYLQPYLYLGQVVVLCITFAAWLLGNFSLTFFL